jgi:transcriptional regulator with XRE-family HTH domain
VPRAPKKPTREWRSAARSSPAVADAVGRLGKRIRALREAKGLTQEELATRAQLDAKHIQTIEAGKTNTTVASLVGIAAALDGRLTDLFEGV